MSELDPQSVSFLDAVRKAAFDCADMYTIDDGLPADAPPELAEAYWDQFLNLVRDQVGGILGRAGAHPECIALMQDFAINAVFDRFAQLDGMPEGGHA